VADTAHKDKLYFVEKNWGAKNFDFRRATICFLRHRLSEHKMTRYAKNLGGWPSWTPGYAYASWCGKKNCETRYSL